MLNAFHAHESAFVAWVEDGYPGLLPATQDYLHFLADPCDERRPRPDGLWPHQWGALLRVIYAREVGGHSLWGAGVLLNIVTGGGKTALIAAAMVWLRLAHDVHRFVVLCPNLTVRDRLEADFQGGRVFVERGLIPPGAFVSADDFALTTLGGTARATSGHLFGGNIVLGNIHQFYPNSPAGQANLHSLLESVQTPLAVFNDEAHNTAAAEYDRTLQVLQQHATCRFRLDTTATPDRADGKPIDSRMIYEYGVPDALHDRVIAQPVVYQPDIETVELTYSDPETGERRHVEEIDWDEIDRAGLSASQWVTDPKPMSQQISIALHRLDEAKRNARDLYQPILFVVAVCKADAGAAQEMLERQFRLRALLVTEDEDEESRVAAAAIGQSGKYDAVVSVAMLREGWDVPEVAVILLLRKFGSKVYGPQVIGRGLRRVRRTGIEPDDPQICAIVDHPKLDHEWLWDLLHARRHRDIGVDDTFDEREEVGEPPPRQDIVNRDLLIDIPEPDGDDPLTPDPVAAENSPPPARDWREQLALLAYGGAAIEITDVALSGVTGRELAAGGWTQHKRAPGPVPVEGDPFAGMDAAALRELLRGRLRAIAEAAVVEAGYAALLWKRVYPPLCEHVAARWLDGEPIPFAPVQALRAAALRLHQLEAALLERTDITRGMVEYGSD